MRRNNRFFTWGQPGHWNWFLPGELDSPEQVVICQLGEGVHVLACLRQRASLAYEITTKIRWDFIESGLVFFGGGQWVRNFFLELHSAH
jgi:hypothetical protein